MVSATVPRDSLERVDAGGWSPLKKSYVGNQTMSGGGAFGPQYVWAHNQIDHYPTSNPQYTEYIEVSLKQPTYLASLELGSPRGMGSVVSLKAWREDTSEWVSFYSGEPRVQESAYLTATEQYGTWTPDVCRLHFKARTLYLLWLDLLLTADC